MKVVIKPVYYCEYCRKRYASKYHCEKHERKCTMNPRRECGFCGDGDIEDFVKMFSGWARITYPAEGVMTGFDEKGNIVEDKNKFATRKKIEFIGPENGLNLICDCVEGCPACTLAIIRQALLVYFKKCPENIPFYFDYRGSKTEWWKTHEGTFDNYEL